MSSEEEDVSSVEEEVDDVSEEEEEEEEVVVPPPKRKRKGAKKNKDPNRPKRNMSAFFLYSNANRVRIKEEHPEAKFGDIAKLLSVDFKKLKPAQNAKWQKLAEKDKERYLKEMETYTPPSEDSDSDDGKKKKKTKKKKDPNAPKRNQSSFFLYSNATRSDVKINNPEAAFGQIAQIISRHFKALPEDERAYWDKKAAQDKERYQAAMSAYKETL